jgi:hypothetical protein
MLRSSLKITDYLHKSHSQDARLAPMIKNISKTTIVLALIGLMNPIALSEEPKQEKTANPPPITVLKKTVTITADNSLIITRIKQLSDLKSNEFKIWPKKPVSLFQGGHYILKEPVKNSADHLNAIALIPKELWEGFYKPKQTIRINNWFITDVSGFTIIASKVGSNKLYFGHQW